jgi:hypothetical protein
MLAVCLGALIIGASYRTYDYFSVDRCLDAGGAWQEVSCAGANE